MFNTCSDNEIPGSSTKFLIWLASLTRWTSGTGGTMGWRSSNAAKPRKNKDSYLSCKVTILA